MFIKFKLRSYFTYLIYLAIYLFRFNIWAALGLRIRIFPRKYGIRQMMMSRCALSKLWFTICLVDVTELHFSFTSVQAVPGAQSGHTKWADSSFCSFGLGEIMAGRIVRSSQIASISSRVSINPSACPITSLGLGNRHGFRGVSLLVGMACPGFRAIGTQRRERSRLTLAAKLIKSGTVLQRETRQPSSWSTNSAEFTLA